MYSNNKQKKNQNLYVSESTSLCSILTAWNLPSWTVVTSVWGAKCSRLQTRLRIVPVPCCRTGVCSRWAQLLPGTNTASDQFLGGLSWVATLPRARHISNCLPDTGAGSSQTAVAHERGFRLNLWACPWETRRAVNGAARASTNEGGSTETSLSPPWMMLNWIFFQQFFCLLRFRGTLLHLSLCDCF